MDSLPIGIATRNSVNNPSYNSGVIQFDIDVKLEMFINNVWTNLNYPGMVIADAESMSSAAGANMEYISAETNGATAWQIFDVRNDAALVNKTPSDYKLEISDNGSHFKLYNNENVSNMGVQAVMFAQGTTALTNVQMKGEGKTALAIGFMAPFDYGDAPDSYGEVAHFMDDLVTNGVPIATNGVYSVVGQTVATEVTPRAKIYIDAQPDADGGVSHFSPNADIDEATTIAKYNGSGTYALTVAITNTTASQSNLGAWIDWNQNGKFDASEAVFLNLAASATSATFTWTGAPVYPDPSKRYYVRVRISTGAITDPNLGAIDGEVEDYYLETAVAISGNVFNDANGLKNNTVDGTGTNVGGLLYVNLVNSAGIVVGTTEVASNGTYGFGGELPTGGYTLQLSTNKGVPGLGSPEVKLPSTWVPTGETIGTAAGNDGTVNSILPLTITAGVAVTQANFGIEQLPENDDKTHVISTPVLNSTLPLNGDGSIASPGPLTGSDPEDGALSANKTVHITDLGNMNGNELYYDGALVAAGTVIDNYDPSKLSIKFTGVGTTSAIFKYTFEDAAGKTGTPETYAISWNSALPVTLISFTGKKEGQISVLNWETTSETNSDYFLVQRSADAKSWYDLGSVKALGESSELEKYFFNDIAPLNGSNLYRLKMVDKDGTFAYSRIRELSFSTGVHVTVFPNPVSNILYISEVVSGTLKEAALYNVKGQKVYQSNGAGSQEINVNALATGMYMIKATHANGTISSHKIVINH